MTGTDLHIPALSTGRLTLRAPKLADFEPWAEFFASDRAIYERGKMDREKAYATWASDVALWQLRGYGPFGVDDAETGDYLGEVGIYQPEGYPGPELGWFVVPEAEGKGIAYEASRAVIAWVRETRPWAFVTSIIEPENTRSIALGLRLGGVIDPTLPGIDEGDVVIRHDLRDAA